MKFRVITARTTSYPNPVVVEAGERVILGERESAEKWPNWIRCRMADNEGWIPAQIIQIVNSTQGIITERYSANELTVNMGDIIVSERVLNGWIWGYNVQAPDVYGWVPLENVMDVMRET